MLSNNFQKTQTSVMYLFRYHDKSHTRRHKVLWFAMVKMSGVRVCVQIKAEKNRCLISSIAKSTMTDSIYTGDDFEDKVKKQVEFYFSDSNLQTDKFLFKIYEANDGWVELKTILTFGRMRQYRPEERAIAALKTSDKLVLSANEDMIRRKDPLKDYNEIKNTRKKNSVHIEGFPTTLSQEDVEEWFNTKILPQLPEEKAVCSIRRVRARANKEFLGIVDVEFKTLADAEFFLGVSVSYADGIVPEAEASEKKDLLTKMSLLTFRQMRESGKRFGVNDVTKRRNSFKDNNRKKVRKTEEKENKDEKLEESAEEKAEDKAEEKVDEKKEEEKKEEEKKEEKKEEETTA
ncbi:lupus La protein [Metschnikowia aff. pulcherrima]|uniref:Lupus La protein n=1 Tax=Metschnikowia aff. pulcherrima TaxID=2163413 RepID=A0A4P6XSX1_9ASCO|nr:lupus La protein [Metschnikowia aff. pulcherrima]